MTWMQLYGYSMNTVDIQKTKMVFIFQQRYGMLDIKMDEDSLIKRENAFLRNLHLN